MTADSRADLVGQLSGRAWESLPSMHEHRSLLSQLCSVAAGLNRQGLLEEKLPPLLRYNSTAWVQKSKSFECFVKFGQWWLFFFHIWICEFANKFFYWIGQNLLLTKAVLISSLHFGSFIVLSQNRAQACCKSNLVQCSKSLTVIDLPQQRETAQIPIEQHSDLRWKWAKAWK